MGESSSRPNANIEAGRTVSTVRHLGWSAVTSSRRFGELPCRVCSIAMIAVAAACATTAPPPPSSFTDFPSPLAGPGHGDLSRAETSHIDRGWRALAAGDPATASNEARLAGTAREAILLDLQAQVVQGVSAKVVEDLEILARRWDESASTWITLSVAAERIGDEPTALAAARRGSELWPSGPFSSRARTLETRWIDDRLELAEQQLREEDYESALTELNTVLQLEPDSGPALLAKARALVGLGEPEQAEESLARLGDMPEALWLRAQNAYEARQWTRSMDLLSRLPQEYPGRQEALRRARLQWRLSVLPPFVQEAAESTALTREHLAVLLVALTPALETVSGGRTPLMQDVLKLPSQRSILTVTRLGIMAPDPIDSRFHPDRLVTVDGVGDAIDSAAHLVGADPPVWCDQGHAERSGCILLQEPMTGRHVTEVLLTTIMEEPEE